MERFFAAALTALAADLTNPTKRREAEVMLGAALAGAVALAPPDSKLHKVLTEAVIGLTGLEKAIGDRP